MNTPKIVGQGSYGCVYDPSIKCKTGQGRGIDYTDKVSKVLSKTNAEDEQTEYTKIEKADPESKYYLGKPVLCDPAETALTEDIIQKCPVLYKPSTSKLLIMKNGGLNISTYVKSIASKPITYKPKFEIFLFKMHHMLLAVQNLLDNNLVHHDLKGQNMVYNENTGEINLIDFGLLRDTDAVIHNSKNNINRLSVAHWSFPFECNFLNKKKYTAFVGFSVAEKNAWYQHLKSELSMSKLNRSLQGSAICNFFQNIGLTKDEMDAWLKDYFDFLVSMPNYETFLNKSVETIDLYGVGLAFREIYKFGKKFMDDELVEKLKKFADSLLDPNLTRRYTVDNAIANYETVVLKDLLIKHKKQFVNHELVGITAASLKSITAPVNVVPAAIDGSRLNITPQLLTAETKKSSRLNTPPVIAAKKKKCGAGQTINNKTNRCIKKCKEGEIRNDNGRCVKNRMNAVPAAAPKAVAAPKRVVKSSVTVRAKSPSPRKRCPNGTRRNKKTGKCEKK